MLVNQLIPKHAAGAGDFLTQLSGVLSAKSVFYFLAWYAVFKLILEGRPQRRAGRSDLALALVVTGANLLPAASAVWLSTTAAALYIWATSRDDDSLFAAATVLLAIALNGYWGPLAFNLFAAQILQADAALVGTVLSAAQDHIVWRETIIGTPGGHSIIVYGPCSSFHNISLGLLCWVTVTKLARTNWIRSDFFVALAICATVILFNATRLSILALGPENFEYWHSGRGADLFAWATTLALLAISLWGAFRTPRPAP